MTNLAVLTLISFAAQAAQPGRTLAEIDRQVAQFTNAAIGEAGGAITPVDRRLRLAPCPVPLALSWYGAHKQSVQVQCPLAGGWRIFVPVRRAAAAANAPDEVVVARGEGISVSISGPGFVLSRQAEAVDAGAVGEWIRVKLDGNKAGMLRARILRTGHAGIDLP